MLSSLWERTAPEAPATRPLVDTVAAEVAVIGAGYTGLSAALHLAASGVSVSVLEARGIGAGGSGRNAGLVNAGMWIRPNEVLSALGPIHGERLLNLLSEAPRAVFDLVREHEIQCEAEHRGTMHCAVGESGMRELKGRAAQWLQRGAPVRLLDAAETARKLGTDAYPMALLDLRAGTIQPLAYARGLARAAITAGAVIFTGSAVVDARRLEGSWIVRTRGGSVRAKWVVVATDAYATGPWASVREEQVPLPYFNVATEPLADRALASILSERQGAWDTRMVLRSFRLDQLGRLVFGSVGALRGTGNRVHTAWARDAIGKTFPQLDSVRLEHAWHGTIGMTPNKLPRFHQLGPNVIAFNGYNGRGIAPGTVFGRLLAQFITGTIEPGDLPVPITDVQPAALRGAREVLYSLGSQAVHLAETCLG